MEQVVQEPQQVMGLVQVQVLVLVQQQVLVQEHLQQPQGLPVQSSNA
jgi:hypothetical protein